jgi:hypothetical protein
MPSTPVAVTTPSDAPALMPRIPGSAKRIARNALDQRASHPQCRDVIAGYGTDVDRDLIHAWWSLRCLTNVRWLAEHGYGSPDEFPEVAVLRSRL